jgi:CRP/FNR family transcriptional regulator, cyclic AMP receptor protein
MPTLSCTVSTLKELAFFSSLPEKEISAALPFVQIRTYPARSIIIRAGGPVDGLFVLVSGQVKVLLEDDRGRQIIVEQLCENDLFGEVGVLQGCPSTEIVQSQTACDLLYIPRKVVMDAISRNTAAATFVLHVLTQRLLHARLQISTLALDDVHTRVVNVLLQHGHEQNGEWFVDVGSESISAMVGASREMVSRVTRSLIERGLARRHKRRIVVLDRASLAHSARRRERITSVERDSPTEPEKRLDEPRQLRGMAV